TASEIGLVARFSSATNFYLGELIKVSGVVYARIYKDVNGTLTQLKSIKLTGFNASSVHDLQFVVQGNSLTLSVSGGTEPGPLSSKTRILDTTFKGPGLVGIRTQGGGSYDSFSVSPATPVLPFLVDASGFTQSPQTDTANWKVQAGSFTLNGT